MVKLRRIPSYRVSDWRMVRINREITTITRYHRDLDRSYHERAR